MKQQTLPVSGMQSAVNEEFSALERLMVQHAEPVKLLSHLLAAIWSLYFTFTHQWATAVIVLIAGGLLGVYSARNADPKPLVKTALGKWFFVMMNPINLTLQLAGYAIVYWAFWSHDPVLALAGTSAVLVGNMFGWDRLERLAK